MIGIYKIISPSGKIYIGQSIDIVRREWNYKKGHHKKQTRLNHSIQKYGWDKHTFEVIEECPIEMLNERERYWQDYYDVLGDNGLNCCLVKSMSKKYTHSKETLEKISKSLKTTFNKPEMKEKLKSKMIELWKKEDFRNKKIASMVNFRDILSAKTKNNESCMKNLLIGRDSKYPIVQYNTKGIFIREWDSVSECSKELDIATSGICNVLNKRCSHYRGFIFFYKYKEHAILKNRYDKDYSNLTLNTDTYIDPSITYRYSNMRKQVLKKDLEGNIIAKYSSIKEASLMNKIPYTTIIASLNRQVKNPRKFKWEYELI